MKVKCRNLLCGAKMEMKFYLKDTKGITDISTVIFFVKCRNCKTISSYALNPQGTNEEIKVDESMNYIG